MSINETLTKYQDFNPPLDNDIIYLHTPKERIGLEKFIQNIPTMHSEYQIIIANGTITKKESDKMKLLKGIVTFESQRRHQSVIAPLLDPSIKLRNDYSLKDLYSDELDDDLIFIRSNLFHLKEICSTSEALLAQGSPIVAAHDVMKYALSQADEAMIPLETKTIARQVLSGGRNTFNNYRVTKHLGRGNYGVVNLIQTIDGKQYAAKTFQNVNGDFNREHFNHEYQHLASINGSYIVKLIHASPPTLFLEFVENGTLKTDLPPEKVIKALSQIAQALSNMHETQKIIHGDLSFSNILIDKKHDIKIADLGLSFFKTEFPKYIQTMNSANQIPYYLPPELKEGKLTKENCEKVDVWSFGILIWTFLKKDDCISPIKSLIWEEPFEGFKEEDLTHQLNQEKILSIDPEGSLVAFMQKCLQVNPSNRPSMKDAVHYFSCLATTPDRDSAINSAPLPSTPSPVWNMSSMEPIRENV